MSMKQVMFMMFKKQFPGKTDQKNVVFGVRI